MKGPFRYVRKFSDLYATIQDSQGRQWEKGSHDVAMYDHSKPVAQHDLRLFSLSTAKAYATESEWLVMRMTSPPAKQKTLICKAKGSKQSLK